MKIPASERVIFEKNPLEDVICQVQFPRRLEIEEKKPVEFQNSVRSVFPLLDVRQATAVHLVIAPNGSHVQENRNKPVDNYEFSNGDRSKKITLTSSAVTLSTSQYSAWGAFREDISLMLSAMAKVYGLDYVTRIGLRYRNIISRKAIGCEDDTWDKLLKPHIAGILSDPLTNEGSVQSKTSHYIISLDSGSVRIQHGLAQHNETKEIGYVIDGDFYVEKHGKVTVEDCLTTLDNFNKEAGNLFRWCITERLYDKLEPQRV